MTFFWLIVFLFLIVLLSVSLFNIISAPRLRDGGDNESAAKVSVLIPARNEEHNIGRCLNALIRQKYHPLEIIVLDDHSEDNTPEIVRILAQQHHNIILLQGAGLPEGWTGKNWACHQLSQVASGDILIFTDADNWHEPEAVSKTISWMHRNVLGLFSAFPQQITKTFSEKLLVTMIDTLLYSLLPLQLVYRLNSPSFSAANGQWIAFTREAYKSLGGHQSVRDVVIEDVELARDAKKSGIKTMTAAGTGMVYARMYRNFPEIWHGMTKILYGLTGYHDAVFWGVLPLAFSAMVLPYVLIWMPGLMLPAGIAIFLNLAIRGGLAVRFRQPFFHSVLLHPLAVLFTLFIGINSYRRYRLGTVRWKGREVVLHSH